MKTRLAEDKGERHGELDSFAISKVMHRPVRNEGGKDFPFLF